MWAAREADAVVVEGVSDLAVAVELVAEDVGHDHGLRVNGPAHLLEGGFVGLDDGVGELAPAGQGGMDGELRRDAADQVCAGFVGKIGDSGVDEGLLDHTGGRRLTVGTGHDHRRDGLCQLAQEIRADFEGYPPGEVGAAPAQQPNGRAGQLAGQHSKENSDLFHTESV